MKLDYSDKNQKKIHFGTQFDEKSRIFRVVKLINR